MKIAMVDPSLFTGRYDDGLCGALARRGADVTLHARPMRATDAITPRNYVYDPRFFTLPEQLRGAIGEGRLFRAIKAADYLATARFGNIRAIANADVVHVQWLPFPAADAALLARLRGSGCTLVHTVHNASAFHGDGGAQGRGYRALLDRFDALIVHGEATRTALLGQGVDGARLHTVPHPPMELAAAGPEDLAAVPPSARPRILFFGTIRPYKGFDLLIEACLAMWRSGVDFDLAVAGKPFMDIAPLVDRVRAAGFGERLIADLGFLTENRLGAHMARADIIAFPYRDIDSSGAFLSALHHGKAMVATRVGMFAALDPDTVALVPPGNADALAGALGTLITDRAERERLGKGALGLRAGLGTWDDAAAATLAVYGETRERAKAA